MMRTKPKESEYGAAETRHRLDALMRAAFSVSPQPMKDIPRKVPTTARKRKAKKPGR